jgi:hypothetical protein
VAVAFLKLCQIEVVQHIKSRQLLMAGFAIAFKSADSIGKQYLSQKLHQLGLPHAIGPSQKNDRSLKGEPALEAHPALLFGLRLESCFLLVDATIVGGEKESAG